MANPLNAFGTAGFVIVCNKTFGRPRPSPVRAVGSVAFETKRRDDRPHRFYSLSLWERVGVRADGWV